MQIFCLIIYFIIYWQIFLYPNMFIVWEDQKFEAELVGNHYYTER
jgi:hypothetical protein